MAKDFYEILGVRRDAPQKEIRQAYRRLARQYHPDVNPGNPEAEARFKEINRAYEVLSDPEDRKKYDQYGDQWQYADQIEEMRRRQGAAGASGAYGPGAYSFSFEDAEDLGDLGDLFGGARGGGGGIFDTFFRRGTRGTARRRGRDIEQPVTISLDEAYRGTTRTIEMREGEERCRVCGGEGRLAGAVCHVCQGAGVAAPVRRIEAKIPAGVEDGARVRLAGRGGPGVNGGSPGDLFLRVRVSPHPRFERQGADLRTEVDVPVWVAALGGEAKVPTLKGATLALKVPAETQAGRVFRLAGQGMPKPGGGYGDLYAKVRLVLPSPMTDEERRLFEQMRDAAERRAGTGEASGAGAR